MYAVAPNHHLPQSAIKAVVPARVFGQTSNDYESTLITGMLTKTRMVGLRMSARLAKGFKILNLFPSPLTLLSFSGSSVSGSQNTIGTNAVIPIMNRAH